MLSVDHSNIDNPPLAVKCVRKIRSALGGEVTSVCVRARTHAHTQMGTIWCICAFCSTVFVNRNIVGKKLFFNVDVMNFAAYAKQLLPCSKAALCYILLCGIVRMHLID